jgi:hypothetical protein
MTRPGHAETEAMTKIREIIRRDIGVKVEGVVKVFDRATLATEIREYVVTDKIEEELKRILDTFTHTSETLRQGGSSRDVMGIWISGFFGSGKSHFAKVLGHLLQNTPLDDEGSEYSIDAFVKHLSDTPRGRDLRLRLGELKLNSETHSVFFEIKSRQPYGRPESVGEILLSEFYRFLGFSENLHVAALERTFERRGLLAMLEAEFEKRFNVAWRSAEGRDDTSTVRSRLAAVLPAVAPDDYPDQKAASQGLKDAFHLGWLTPEKIAEELVQWVVAQKPTGGKAAHLVFVIDEMGTFIGDSNDRISELNSIAEMVGNKGKGKVWLAVTSQQDLERVVDRTNFQPALVGRLNARFELKPHLISDEINKVVSERILKKRPAHEGVLRDLYKRREGMIAQLADLKASRHLGSLSERGFIDTYPLLPHQVRLAQDIFEALSGFRISGGVRSMISVAMDTLQEVAEEKVGVIVSFDQIFDGVENDLLSQEYLGASGVRSIYESNERVSGTPVEPARLLKVLWLLQRVTWVPRVPETLTKLLVRDLEPDLPALRADVERTLDALQEAGYVSRDEATGEWKFLNERERTIEQAIQEMVRPGGSRSISLAAIRRTSQDMCKEDLLAKRRLANYTVTYGATKLPFPFGVFLDNEAVETGPELDVHFVSPLAPGRTSYLEDVRRQNQAAGAKGRTAWWVADAPDSLEVRLKRYEALAKVTGDKRFVDDSSADTQDALSEKRKERDELRAALVKDLERAFMRGTLLYGGQELELEGGTDLKEPITRAVTTAIPNVYPRFSISDKPFDLAKQLKGLLNPSTSKLHDVAPELDLFDTQGSLQRDSALVGQVLEVLRDLEDEGIDPTGARLLDAKEASGFKGFTRAPFGWPDELVRLVLAACFRAGAIYIERQTGAGPTAVYEYHGSEDHFEKVNTFKKTRFRVAETSLSVDQIKEAGRALIALGVKGTPESGNAIAAAVRQLGQALKQGLDDARVRAEEGLPIPENVLGTEGALTEVITARDPTLCVTSFLAEVDRWKSLKEGLTQLRGFLDDNRHKDFERSLRLKELAANHPLPAAHAGADELEGALQDMEAIVAAREVIPRWGDYRDAFDRAFGAYRKAYVEIYDKVREEMEAAVAAIQASPAYQQAPANTRDGVLEKTFGAGAVCHYPPLSLSSVSGLLEATGRRSLSSLEQALVALPAYRAQVEAELRTLGEPPPPEHKRVYEWRSSRLAGRRFVEESDVDQALSEVADELKAQIREGFLVVVK